MDANVIAFGCLFAVYAPFIAAVSVYRPDCNGWKLLTFLLCTLALGTMDSYPALAVTAWLAAWGTTTGAIDTAERNARRRRRHASAGSIAV